MKPKLIKHGTLPGLEALEEEIVQNERTLTLDFQYYKDVIPPPYTRKFKSVRDLWLFIIWCNKRPEPLFKNLIECILELYNFEWESNG